MSYSKGQQPMRCLSSLKIWTKSVKRFQRSSVTVTLTHTHTQTDRRAYGTRIWMMLWKNLSSKLFHSSWFKVKWIYVKNKRMPVNEILHFFTSTNYVSTLDLKIYTYSPLHRITYLETFHCIYSEQLAIYAWMNYN